MEWGKKPSTLGNNPGPIAPGTKGDPLPLFRLTWVGIFIQSYFVAKKQLYNNWLIAIFLLDIFFLIRYKYIAVAI